MLGGLGQRRRVAKVYETYALLSLSFSAVGRMISPVAALQFRARSVGGFHVREGAPAWL